MAKKSSFWVAAGLSVLVIIGIALALYFNLHDEDEGTDGLPEHLTSLFGTFSTPYVFIENVTINEAFSESSACPWGFTHDGINIVTVENGTLFRAVADGRITRLQKFRQDTNSNYQVNMQIRVAGNGYVGMAWEFFTSSESDADLQLSMLNFREGDRVNKDDILGTLLVLGHGTHVHWDVQQGSKHTEKICPEPFFNESARLEIMSLLNDTFPGANMCYA